MDRSSMMFQNDPFSLKIQNILDSKTPKKALDSLKMSQQNNKTKSLPLIGKRLPIVSVSFILL